METQIQVNPKTRFFTISTAGHVDHGKTSLIRRLTGIDPDRLKEEKERQMTTDLGFAHLQVNADLVLGFVDVPGHGKFLKNMLAGVGGIDLALLVIAADEGPMPQTKQHVRILSMLGIKKAIVAVTKIDLADEETIEIVKQEALELVTAHGMEMVDICLVSSTKGTGFDELKDKLRRAVKDFKRQPGANDLFFPVDRVFTKSGFGTVVTGTLVAGKLKVGDQVIVEPGNLQARVRRLETFGYSVDTASPGQRLACNLVVKDHEKLSRGHVVLSHEDTGSKLLIVSLNDRPRTLNDSLSERLSDQPVRLYHGTAEYHGFLRWVEDLKEDDSQGGQSAIAFLSLQEPGIIQAQDRFVVRLTDDSIYGGSILLRERPRWLTKLELLKVADHLRFERFHEAVMLFMESAPQMVIREEQLSAILPDSERASFVKTLKESGSVAMLGEYLIRPADREALTKDTAAKLKSLLEKLENQDDGVSLDTLRQSLQVKLERQAFLALIEEEAAAERLVRKGDKLHASGDSGRGSAAILAELKDLEEKVKDALNNHWCLEFEELAEISGGNLKNVKSVVTALSKQGDVIVAGYDFVAAAPKVKEAHQILADIWNAKRVIAPTDFREKLNTTRKYAMALLQYFDDAKITRRLDSGRVLLKGPR